MQQRAKKARSKVQKVREETPWVFGYNTYIYAAIAINGGVARQTDVYTSISESAARIDRYDAEHAGVLRTFRLKAKQGRGPRAVAIMFDETFPLAKEVFALARKIGECHPLAIDDNMPEELPPPPPPATHRIDLIAGSEVNTLVLATVRALRGKVGLVELAAAVPYDSLTAVERAVRRLRDYGILDGGEGLPIHFTDAPWKPQLERLYDAYLRQRPELRDEIRARSKRKKARRAERSDQELFGYATTQRILTTLAIHGPMTRAKLRSITMFTHANKTLNPLVDAGIIALDRTERDGTRASRENLVVSLNAACPIYRELRATLLALSGEPAKSVRDLSDARDDYDIAALFNSESLFWALLMVNAVPGGELDIASLNRLRPQHAPFTFHGRRQWLLDEGFTKERRSGHMRYFGLNPDHRAYKPLKRLLDKIAMVSPDMVAAAQYNDDLKPERRLTEERNAKARERKARRATR